MPCQQLNRGRSPARALQVRVAGRLHTPAGSARDASMGARIPAPDGASRRPRALSRAHSQHATGAESWQMPVGFTRGHGSRYVSGVEPTSRR